MSVVRKPEVRHERRRRPKPMPRAGVKSLMRRHPIWTLFVCMFLVECVLVTQITVRQHRLAELRSTLKARAQDIIATENELARRESLEQVGQRARAMGMSDATRVAYFPPPPVAVTHEAPVTPRIGMRAAW